MTPFGNVTAVNEKPPPAHALIWCSGTSESTHASVSFAGMQVELTEVQSAPLPARLQVLYHGHRVFAGQLPVGFPVPIPAPGTSGQVCIAKMRGYRTPIALDYTIFGTCGAEHSLQAVYPTRDGGYAATNLTLASGADFRMEVLGGSVVAVTGDARFDFLFTSCAGGAAPVLVERLENGHFVDVSKQFSEAIAADARNLRTTMRTQSCRSDSPWCFIGVTNAWVADECRLGKGARAWRIAEEEVTHGPNGHVMAEYGFERSYIRQLRAVLARWGYCAAPE